MKATTLFFLMITTLVLAQCKSKQPVFQDQTPFKYSMIYAQDWVGGQPGNAGTYVTIEIDDPAEITPDSMYYQQRIVPVEVRETNDKTQWIGRFKTITRRQINLNENPDADIEEEVPVSENFPFELKEDEVVLLYHDDDGSYYYKWQTVKKKKPIFYPTTKPKPRMNQD